ncbi:hypothetical protein F511_03138 [Dorcoceras hygrometricum]|nr:hypothetical protein F511_03138 [Dorcoceras hygrometricum]
MGLPKVLSFAFLLFLESHARNDCSAFICGNNQFEVRFPFRLVGQQPQNCGYPGFDLSCGSQGAKAVMTLPYSGDFWVRDVDYLMQEIKLYDPDGCLPRRLLSLNLSSSPFTSGYSKNYTILSCPPEFARYRFTVVDCLSTDNSLVLATSSMNLARTLNMCSTVGMYPIPVPWPDNGGLTSDLNGDLRLMWNVPNCLDCEAKGDVCGFANSTSDQILCFSHTKGGKSRGLEIFKIIVLSVVIPAIFCSICISCFIVILERRQTAHPENAVAPLERAPDNSAISGLDDSTIESYSKVVLGESRRVPGPNGATCPICLADYHPMDTVRCIPLCEHCFHSECIDEWLKRHGTCPLCRNSPSPTPGANTSIAIKYPFILQSLIPPNDCTYIKLTCKTPGNTMLLNLPYYGDFVVRNIDYLAGYIELQDPGNCLMRRLFNLNISSSDLEAGSYLNYTIYDCPFDTGSLFNPVSCLSNSANVTIVTRYLSQEIMEIYGCKAIGSLIIPLFLPGQLKIEEVFIGFSLILSFKATVCNDCQETKTIAIACFICPKRTGDLTRASANNGTGDITVPPLAATSLVALPPQPAGGATAAIPDDPEVDFQTISMIVEKCGTSYAQAPQDGKRTTEADRSLAQRVTMARLLENLAVFLLIIAGIAAVVPPCPTVDSQLSACVSYIEGKTPDTPPPACCTGVKTVAGEEKNQQDKVAICNCIKQAIEVLGHPVIPSRIAHLPVKCGLNFEFPPIDAHYDCSKISSWN